MAGDVTPHYFATSPDLDEWLHENEDTSPGIWVVAAKKGSPMATVTYEQALLVALAHGWIDGHTKSLDKDSFIQRLSPRRPKSTWSLRNVHRAEEMIKNGTIRPRGLAEIERAKADGRWTSIRPDAGARSVPPSASRPLDDHAQMR
jgi:uncharacterized protein YdeI (YjbR/CyaY-like superfamily)